MESDAIKAIKKEIGFREQISCSSCSFRELYEKDANSPIQAFCTYAGNIKFEVDEEDWCNKWSEL